MTTQRTTGGVTGLDEVVDSLRLCGFQVADVRDAPDRPGEEHVFVARK